MRSKLCLVVVGAGFWGAVLLAFWLGSRTRSPGLAPTIANRTDGDREPVADSTRSAPPRDVAATTSRGKSAKPGDATDLSAVDGPSSAAQPASSPEVPAEDLGAREMAPGEIVELNYDFPSEEARREYELDQKARWERRKAQEIERIGEYLTRELKLDSVQASRLKALLLDESHRRVELVSDLTEGRIDQTRFRRSVDEIRESARAMLASLLTLEQMAHYRTLEPRKQVLLEGTITDR